MAAEKDKSSSAAAPSTMDQVKETVARVIPGFKQPTMPEKKPSRSRNKKPKATASSISTPVEEADTSAVHNAGAGAATSDPTLIPPPGTTTSEIAPQEEKKTSAVEAVQKRIRSATKKIQRIVTYEEKTEALNADQRNAVASKPALEATVKELQELLVILKAEEAEDEARDARNKTNEEKRQSQAVEAAVASAKKNSQSDVVLLLQFLHLHSLYSQDGSFAPVALPSVVENATGQEVAAVKKLQYELCNGPLLGGHDDALEKIAKVSSGSSDEVLPQVPYSRIKELIAGLTSEPSSSNSAPAVSAPIENAPAGPADSTTALVDGSVEEGSTGGAPSFLQASEILPSTHTPSAEEKVHEWQPDVETPSVSAPATQKQPETTAASVEPELAQALEKEALADDAPAAPAAAPTGWGAPQAPVDWSEEQSGDLPHLDELTPAPSPPLPKPETAASAPRAPAARSAPVVEDDGFQAVAGARKGNERRGGGPGGFRGRGGGSFRGGNREGGPRRGPPGEGRGGFQGGEGRPEGRGEGRGEARGAHHNHNHSGEPRGEFRGRGRGRGGPRGGQQPGGQQRNGSTPSLSSLPPAITTPATASPAAASPAPSKW